MSILYGVSFILFGLYNNWLFLGFLRSISTICWNEIKHHILIIRQKYLHKLLVKISNRKRQAISRVNTANRQRSLRSFGQAEATRLLLLLQVNNLLTQWKGKYYWLLILYLTIIYFNNMFLLALNKTGLRVTPKDMSQNHFGWILPLTSDKLDAEFLDCQASILILIM